MDVVPSAPATALEIAAVTLIITATTASAEAAAVTARTAAPAAASVTKQLVAQAPWPIATDHATATEKTIAKVSVMVMATMPNIVHLPIMYMLIRVTRTAVVTAVPQLAPGQPAAKQALTAIPQLDITAATAVRRQAVILLPAVCQKLPLAGIPSCGLLVLIFIPSHVIGTKFCFKKTVVTVALSIPIALYI